MTNEELIAILDRVQTGAPAVIGYGAQSQEAYAAGYSHAMNLVYEALVEIGLEVRIYEARGVEPPDIHDDGGVSDPATAWETD